MTALEGGHGALACASGMAAIHMALLAALTDRPQSVLAANALYGATISLLDECPRAARASRCASPMPATWTRFRAAVAEARPGCVLMETISNPLLRVARAGPAGGDRARGRARR